MADPEVRLITLTGPGGGAAVAARIGDHEALAVATGNLFGQVLNARDTEEMRRLRPGLLALLTLEASARSRGWTNYFLALDAYVDGMLDAACEHATLSVGLAREIGHEVMLASAVGTLLLSQSARDGVITQPALAEAIELMRPPSVQPLAAFARTRAPRGGPRRPDALYARTRSRVLSRLRT
jgi:hypothetical protein